MLGVPPELSRRQRIQANIKPNRLIPTESLGCHKLPTGLDSRPLTELACFRR